MNLERSYITAQRNGWDYSCCVKLNRENAVVHTGYTNVTHSRYRTLVLCIYLGFSPVSYLLAVSALVDIFLGYLFGCNFGVMRLKALSAVIEKVRKLKVLLHFS